MGHSSAVYGVSSSHVVEAVPPTLVRVQMGPSDASTSELLLEYNVVGTAGRMYYALWEVESGSKGGKVIWRRSELR